LTYFIIQKYKEDSLFLTFQFLLLIVIWNLLFPASNPLIFIFVSAHHAGSLLYSLFFLLVILERIKISKIKLYWLVTAGLISDQLILVTAIIPFLIYTFFYARASFRVYFLLCFVSIASAYTFLIFHNYIFSFQIQRYLPLIDLLKSLGHFRLPSNIAFHEWLLYFMAIFASAGFIILNKRIHLIFLFYVLCFMTFFVIITLDHTIGDASFTPRYRVAIAFYSLLFIFLTAIQFIGSYRFSLILILIFFYILSSNIDSFNSYGELSKRSLYSDPLLSCIQNKIDEGNGLSDYWQSKKIEALSRHKLKLYAINEKGEPYHWMNRISNYPEFYSADFYLIKKDFPIYPELKEKYQFTHCNHEGYTLFYK